VDVARAKDAIVAEKPLYERDFCRWAETQARLLKQGDLERLDIVNLVEEIEDLGIREKKAVRSNLVVVLMHLLKHKFQPRRRSRSWLASILEHRQRLRVDLRTSPSLRGYAQGVFREAYADARARASVETGMAEHKFPPDPPYALEQTLDPDFLPD
jgi:Domain of unknown function DUF29